MGSQSAIPVQHYARPMDKNDQVVELLTEIRDLLKEAVRPDRRQRVDAVDLLGQLGSAPSIKPLRHYYAWNDRWSKLLEERNRRAAVQTYDFIEQQMDGAFFTMDQFHVIESMADEIMALDGQLLDLGVYKGASTRRLASIFPDAIIHGFDSFEGLPDDWAHVPRGAFGDIAGTLPEMPENVQLYKGWFSDTLPVWRTEYEGPISMLRVDCDIYSSTVDIFDAVGEMLHPECVIVFDELIGYYGWQHHEHKAFAEFVEKESLAYEYVAYGLTYTIARLVPA